MAIAPYAAGTVAGRRSGDLFVSMRREMEGLQQQLATGRKAESYGGLGLNRQTSLDFRGRLSAMAGYEAGIKDADLRLNLMSKGLERLESANQDTKKSILPPSFQLGTDGKTNQQRTAYQNLQASIDVLNTDVNGRYLFAGRATDQPPVEPADTILNGNGTQIGLIQFMNDRRTQALSGAGNGRLTVGGAGASATLTQDDATGFGLVVTAVRASNTGAVTLAQPAGSPAASSFTLSANASNSDTFSVDLSYPDGTSETVTLTARNAVPLGQNDFLIGADANATAANLRAALQAKTTDRLGALQAASDSQTAKDFFDRTNLPVPPAAQVIDWYKGDAGGFARDTAPVQIDRNQFVATGARANEEGFRQGLIGLAALAATTFTDTAGDRVRYEELATRVRDQLSPPAGTQTIPGIAAELGNAQAAMKAASESNKATGNLLQEMIDQVENANDEEVAVSILSLQTRLQASYQTTSILSKLSLVNFL